MDRGQPRATSLEIGVLGPLRLCVDGQEVAVPGPARRAVLALLAMAGGRSVGVDAIIDAVWPDEAPDSGPQALHSHISRLRRTLGPAAHRLTREGRGYALALEPGELDAAEVRRAAALVRARLQADPAAAARAATAALHRWRGDPLSEFSEVAPLAAEAVGLRELRATLRDDALEARLALGEGGLAAEVAAATAEHPLRERTVTLLVRVLAGEGRTSEAMEAALSFRRRLVDETGMDPGPAFSRLEQQVAAGELAAATPLSRERPRPPLARPRGPMVGRGHDRNELLRLLEQREAVTVTGPGGVGKTRLVLDVAAELAERGTATVFVPLAAVTQPSRVPEAVAAAAALRIGTDPSVASVSEALAGEGLLLVLDNCEHVVAACRDLVSRLQARAPGVRVLATSRTTLHVPAEYVVRLQPLPLPPPVTALPEDDPGRTGRLLELSRQPAVRAFLEHARRRQGEGFTLTAGNAGALVDVLRRLDGLPLAIELAAGQLAVLPVGALHDRLGRALDVLAAEQPAEQTRHRTLRTTVAWSYELLGPDEQSLLRALAPFPGGADLETVEQLASADTGRPDPLVLLSRLVDASLVAVDQPVGERGAARYSLLDTVRAFLLDELDARDERTAAEQSFLRWAGETAAAVSRGLRSADEPAADRRLRAELPNFRAARDLARRYGDLELQISITLAFHDAGIYRDISELWTWSRELAADPSLAGHPQEVVVLGSAAESSWVLGKWAEAEALAHRGLDVASQTGVAEELTRRCWSALAVVALFRADFETSRSRWLKAATFGDNVTDQLGTAAMASAYAGDRRAAGRLLARARAQAREAYSPELSVSRRAYLHYAAGEVATDAREAIREYDVARELARSCGASFVDGVAMVGLASARAAIGDVAGAADEYLTLLHHWPVTGNRTQLWTTVRNAAALLLEQDRTEAGALLLARADAAESASSVGGESGGRLSAAQQSVADRLGPSGLAEVRARAAATSVPELLDLARDELRRLSALKRAERSTPDWESAP